MFVWKQYTHEAGTQEAKKKKKGDDSLSVESHRQFSAF
jgi:hypothetical protein